MTSLPIQIPLDTLTIGSTAYRGNGQAVSLTCCVGPDGSSYLLKEYREDTIPKICAASMDELVSWRTKLNSLEREQLDLRCAWPRAVVYDKKQIRGVLIPAAAPDMIMATTSISRYSSARPRHVDVLTRRYNDAIKLRVPYYEPPTKLAVLGNFLDTMLWLHQRGFVIGDLQPRNALFSEQNNRIFLIDCDSCVPIDGVPAFPPEDPEIWKCPRPGPFNRRTDAFKFAWMIVRCLQEQPEAVALEAGTLLRMMESPTYVIIARICNGLGLEEIPESWEAKAAIWPRLVTPDRLYVQIDGSIRQRWTCRSQIAEEGPTWISENTLKAKPSEANISAQKLPGKSAGSRTIRRILIISGLLLALFVVVTAIVAVFGHAT